MNAIVVLLVVISAGVLLFRWWLVTHPRTRCGWCRGSGKNRLSGWGHEGDCRHCGGSGKRRSRLLPK